MDRTCVLEVEAVQRGRCTHACDGMCAHEQVQRGKPTEQIWIVGRIHPVPDTHQPPITHFDEQLLARNYGQQLRRCRETA